jgi:ubiquinone/menaquinone biosynthesis C-methylase UbiE
VKQLFFESLQRPEDLKAIKLAGMFLLIAFFLWQPNEAFGQVVPPTEVEQARQDEAESTKGQPKKSVKPGINETFLDPELSVDDYVTRFEIESREIYDLRHELLRLCDIKPGERVADIGAGTGLFTRMFSKATGPTGWVFAVDIAPRFIEHINRDAALHNLKNITGVICQEDSVTLPPDSVDVVFICDTYHHFEYPEDTMASIHRALRENGRLYLIDFIREPEVSREWILGHVRAGQAEVTKELESFGFELVEHIKVNRLQENYMLHFRKKR